MKKLINKYIGKNSTLVLIFAFVLLLSAVFLNFKNIFRSKKLDGFQDINLENSPNSKVFQAGGGDIYITEQADSKISSMVLKVVYGGTLKEGISQPPKSYSFLGNFPSAQLRNYENDQIVLNFSSPLQFENRNEEILVKNTFLLESNSSVIGQPLENLKKFTEMYIPFIALSFDNQFSKINYVEIDLLINGQIVFDWKQDLNVIPDGLGMIIKNIKFELK